MQVYDEIGKGYDVTRQSDPYLTGRIAEHLQIKQDGQYLDLACGTGNYTTALASEYGGRWTGLDVSTRMIEEAKKKTESINWMIGDCAALPLPDCNFSGVLCSLAIHHFASLSKAFQEAFRVMQPGRFVIFTATPEQMQHYWLCEYFPKAMHASILQMPALSSVTEALRDAGFELLITEHYEIKDNLKDLFLYSGKSNPSMYLDPSVRAGISTFAKLADNDEIQTGCKRLAEDIESGKISLIQSRFEHSDGDYLFVVAEKR